jgi:hypothetical protein
VVENSPLDGSLFSEVCREGVNMVNKTVSVISNLLISSSAVQLLCCFLLLLSSPSEHTTTRITMDLKLAQSNVAVPPTEGSGKSRKRRERRKRAKLKKQQDLLNADKIVQQNQTPTTTIDTIKKKGKDAETQTWSVKKSKLTQTLSLLDDLESDSMRKQGSCNYLEKNLTRTISDIIDMSKRSANTITINLKLQYLVGDSSSDENAKLFGPQSHPKNSVDVSETCDNISSPSMLDEKKTH